MQFSHRWTDDDISYYAVEFTTEELDAAAAATGLDASHFKGMHVFNNAERDPHLDTYGPHGPDPRAVTYIEPLVVAAIKHRDEFFAVCSAWHTAQRQGWQVLDASGQPVPEPTRQGWDWS